MSTSLAIVFDAVGTILQPEPSVAVAYAQLGSRYGVSVSSEEMEGRLQRAWSSRTVHAEHDSLCHVTSQFRERSFWLEFVQEVFAPQDPSSGLFADLWEHFADPAHWRLLDDVVPTWQALNELGHRIFVASNFDNRIHAIAAQLFPSTVQHVWDSASIGWRKPSPHFFDHIAQSLQLPPNQLVYVGDDLAHDYDPPRKLNWRAYHLRRAAQGVPPAAIRSEAFVLPTLADLPLRLGRGVGRRLPQPNGKLD